MEKQKLSPSAFLRKGSDKKKFDFINNLHTEGMNTNEIHDLIDDMVNTLVKDSSYSNVKKSIEMNYLYLVLLCITM